MSDICLVKSDVDIEEYVHSEWWLDGLGFGFTAAIEASQEAIRLFGDEGEACGYIVIKHGPRGRYARLYVCENTSEYRGSGEFAYSDVASVNIYQHMEDGTLLGLWHSHPLGHRYPSLTDWLYHPRGVPLFIVSIESSSESTVLRFTDEDRPDVSAS